MSPVGDGLRIRSRKFPGIINGTNINWFHSWPKDALYDVAFSFLKDIEFPQPDLIKKLADNMAETHHNIDETNKLFAL
jgi:dynein heavy chain